MWLAAEDKLPRRIQVVSLDDPKRLRHNLVLSDWQIDVPVRPEVFTSLRAAGTQRMDSTDPHPRPHPASRLLRRIGRSRSTLTARSTGNGTCRWMGLHNYYGGTVQRRQAALQRITNHPTDTDTTRRPLTDTKRPRRLDTTERSVRTVV